MPRSPAFSFPQDFGFVLNPFSFTGELPLELTAGVFLDKAVPSERDTIRELIKEMGGLANWGMLFDFEAIPRELQSSPEWDRRWWPKETYWVIRGGSSHLVE